LNINWLTNQVPFKELFYFTISIPQTIKLRDLFFIDDSDGTNEIDNTYILNAIVCFTGAHYFSYVK
jgi:hypothetical protein